MTIARILEGRDTGILTCEAATLVRDAIAILSERRIGALPVIDGNKVLGIFSERDVIYKIAALGSELLDERVSDVMTSPAVTVERDTSALAALSLMTKRRIRHLPVVEDDRLIGFVSIGDLVKYRIDRIESEAEAMRNYIQMA